MALNHDHEPDHDFSDTFVGFDPPLYKQRYKTLADLVTKLKVTTLVDYGCAEVKFLKYLIDSNDPRLQHLKLQIGVDYDQDILEEFKFRLKPTYNQLLHKRLTKLMIKIYCGNVAELDLNIKNYLNTQDSVTLISLIELIEHLNPDTLKIFPNNVFNYLRPNYIFISTPNSDFNVLFPDFYTKSEFPGFRHWDHKFEFSRAEFKNWCNSIVQNCTDRKSYFYKVKYINIGNTEKSIKNELGPCSQACLFERVDILDKENKENFISIPNKISNTTKTEKVTFTYDPIYTIDNIPFESLKQQMADYLEKLVFNIKSDILAGSVYAIRMEGVRENTGKDLSEIAYFLGESVDGSADGLIEGTVTGSYITGLKKRKKLNMKLKII